jgi:hypothetical protein
VSRPKNEREGSSGGPSGADPAPGDAENRERPAAATVVSLIVFAEALALLALAAWYGYELLTSTPASFWGAVFTLGLLVVFSGWLFAVGHFLFRGFRWPRAAALVTQLFVLTVGVPAVTGGFFVIGLVMVLPAALVLILLFNRKVIAYGSKTVGGPPAL